jgi:hypothetical protein
MATSLTLALPSGGPTVIVYGVIVAGLGSLALAASLAEICAVYPTGELLPRFGYLIHIIVIVSRWPVLLDGCPCVSQILSRTRVDLWMVQRLRLDIPRYVRIIKLSIG